jgi:hypothetical protein
MVPMHFACLNGPRRAIVGLNGLEAARDRMTAARPPRKTSNNDLFGMASAMRIFVPALAATIMLVLSMSASAVAEPTFSFGTTPDKLPKTVIPLHHAIELTPDLESLAAAGVEVVDIEATSSS